MIAYLMHKWHALKSWVWHGLGNSLQRTKKWDRDVEAPKE